MREVGPLNHHHLHPEIIALDIVFPRQVHLCPNRRSGYLDDPEIIAALYIMFPRQVHLCPNRVINRGCRHLCPRQYQSLVILVLRYGNFENSSASTKMALKEKSSIQSHLLSLLSDNEVLCQDKKMLCQLCQSPQPKSLNISFMRFGCRCGVIDTTEDAKQ